MNVQHLLPESHSGYTDVNFQLTRTNTARASELVSSICQARRGHPEKAARDSRRVRRQQKRTNINPLILLFANFHLGDRLSEC